jgi:HlyD family secretion protein
MLWIRLRYLAVVTLAVGVGSGGASIYVRGSQEPAPKDGQPVSKRPMTATAQTPQPEGSKKATGQPATAESQVRLRAQQLATRKAKASYQIARLTRELAELAVEEYEEVTYPRDLATVGAEIALAKSDLTRSRDRLDWAKRMFEKKYVSPATKTSEELNLEKAKFALEQAESKKNVLVKYTRDKTIKELRSAVEKARLDELYKQAALDEEMAKELELEHQLRPKAN